VYEEETDPLVEGAPDRAEPEPTPAPRGYTLGQLSRLSGVPARTIRFYRQEGLIHPPRRVGRFAFYGPEQLGRLRFIVALRDRGLGLDAVATFLADPSGRGHDFFVQPAVRDELTEPWITDHAAVIDRTELVRLLGNDDPIALEGLEAYGVISKVKDRPDSYDVPSLAVFELATEFYALGTEGTVIAEAWIAMGRHMAQLADELVTIFGERPSYGFPESTSIEERTSAFARIRPIALRAVQLAFAQEIQRAITDYVALAVPPDAED
jgi:DNA-binding transcriptional MerR regulator